MPRQKGPKKCVQAIKSSSMLDPDADQQGLLNLFIKDSAIGQTYNDLLNFRKIGEEEYLIRVSYFILKNHSVRAPNRKRSLKHFLQREQPKKGE